jgi:hypothetical protein
MQAKTRRRRCDVNHAVYCITNTVTGEQYVGITACGGQVRCSLHVRMQKHLRRALTEQHDWALCNSLRRHGAVNHTYGLLEVVRGRAQAHQRERELIRIHNPALNTA